MKRVIIVVEGPTEQEFIKQCLAPYLLSYAGIQSVTARLIGKPGHKGGDVRYNRLKVDLEILLREPGVLVSSFIDFFKLGKDFPNSDTCSKHIGIDQKIKCLEESLFNHIASQSFLPYIQCHEFKALLFSSQEGFRKYFNSKTCEKLAEVNMAYPNPEHINSSQPPSYRLVSIVEKYEGFNYKKVIYGNILALEVGIDSMIATCPRFAIWIETLIRKASE